MKKRGAIYSVVALMLCLAVYLNWYYTKTDEDYGNATDYQADGKVLGESVLVNNMEQEGEAGLAAQTDTEYFSQARLSRQQARDEMAAAAAPKTAVTCPYCGATTIPDASGCCEYCGGSVNG